MQANIQIYRTDEVGTVIVSTDGAKLTIDKEASSFKENAPPNAITSQEVTSDATGGKSYDDIPIATEGYIGNKNSKKFHLPTCGSLPATKNQIILKTRDEAINNGYVPCKRCNP